MLDGYAPASAVGEANGIASQPLMIQLQQAGAVQVTVLKGSEPLPGARGWLAPDGFTGETLADGTMKWTAVTPGTATLGVAENRQSDAVAKTVELEVRSGEVTDITVELP